jgi:hypothetical protein
MKIAHHMTLRPGEFGGCDIGSHIPLADVIVRVVVIHNHLSLATRDSGEIITTAKLEDAWHWRCFS